MRISSFKIIIVSVVLTLIGLSLIPRLSVKLNPSNTLTSVRVDFNWPGASSNSVERQITTILEGGFSTLRNVEKITSRSSKDGGYVQINFDKYADIDVSRFEAATIIRQLYKSFPENASYPNLSVNRPDDDRQQVFLSYTINAPRARYEIQEIVKARVAPIIGALREISDVNVSGANPKEFLIQYNQEQLQALKLNKQELTQAVQQVYNRISIGQLINDKHIVSVAVRPGDETIDWHIPIKNVAGRIIYLDDIATIKEQEQEALSYYRVNGQNAITLNLNATKNANTIALAQEVKILLKEIKKTLPLDYRFIKNYDSTEYLKSELDKTYKRSLYTLIILLLFIGLISLSFRYLLVVVLCLAANIGVAFVFYYLFQVEIQLYSIAGITISLGLIIDNIIVMTDHLRMQGDKKVFVPILASTLTTIGALSVINFLEDQYKLNLIDFAKVIGINLGVSLLVALYLVPALLSKIKFRQKGTNKAVSSFSKFFYSKYIRVIAFLLRYKKWALTAIILVFGIPFFMLPKQLEGNDSWFEKAYNNTLGNTWYLENARPSIDKYLGGSFQLFSKYVYENAYYSQNEETKLYVVASMDKGATVHQMNEVFIGLENYLNSYSEIKKYASNVTDGDYARMEITFKEAFSKNTFPSLLKARLIRKALEFGGIEWSIYGVGQGFNNGGAGGLESNFTVQAKGYDYQKLTNLAQNLKKALEVHPRIEEAYITDNGLWNKKVGYEYAFSLDKEILASQESFPQRFTSQLKDITLQKSPNMAITAKGLNFDLRFESSQASQFDLWDIKKVPLDSLNTPKRFDAIGTIVKVKEQENIDKENQEYLRKVKFQYAGSAKFGDSFLVKTLDSLNSRLPLGFSFERDNQNWNLLQGKETEQYSWLLLLVMAIIYLLCAVLFESFTQPFIILSVIPISFIGVFLTFYWFDFNFDQGGLASFVLLSGLTVNASIFILNDFNELRKNNIPSIEAYVRAFKQKIFPILLTIISTILGFIPFVIDGQNEVFWFALGVGTMGGLLFSLIGILFYLPLFSLKSQWLEKTQS